MIKINLKRALGATFLCLFVAINPAKADADTGESLKKLYEMRTITYSILGDYYMFSGLEGDSRYNRDMETDIKRFQANLSYITADGTATSKLGQLATTLNNWHAFKELLDTNRADFLTQGYANARLVNDLSIKATVLDNSLETLYQALLKGKQFPVSKWTQYTRDMSIIIQTITAEYAARSTSSLGQVMSLEINEGGMDEQAKVFDKLLTELKTAPKNKKVFRTLDQLGVKWTFIEKSIANYNQNAVPFIMSTYGNRITQNLESIGNHYSKTAQAKN